MVKVWGVSPEGVLFEGETDSVVAPAYDGEIGILSGHAPLMALLGDGELRLGTGSGRSFNVSGGVVLALDKVERVVVEKDHAAPAQRADPPVQRILLPQPLSRALLASVEAERA